MWVPYYTIFLAYCGKGGATIIGDSLPQKSGIASRHLSLYLERLNGAAASGVSTIRQPHFVASEEGTF